MQLWSWSLLSFRSKSGDVQPGLPYIHPTKAGSANQTCSLFPLLLLLTWSINFYHAIFGCFLLSAPSLLWFNFWGMHPACVTFKQTNTQESYGWDTNTRYRVKAPGLRWKLLISFLIQYVSCMIFWKKTHCSGYKRWWSFLPDGGSLTACKKPFANS